MNVLFEIIHDAQHSSRIKKGFIKSIFTNNLARYHINSWLNYIFKWRFLQEQKLKLTTKSKNTMSKTQIKEFIMFYERITKHMMKNYSKISDLTVFLDKNHRSKSMRKF